MPQRTDQHTVTETEIGRIDRIVQTMTGLPRAKVAGLFDHGCVWINSQPCDRTFHRVAPGDVVRVRHDPANPRPAKPRPWSDAAFGLVHEDEHLIVVDKAAWVLTVPREDESAEGGGPTLIGAVGAYLKQRGGRANQPLAVQRLDRGTSGLLVLAKSASAAEGLRRQFAGHTTVREYLALVAGLVEIDAGTFDTNMSTGANLTRFSTPNRRTGQRAVTHYRVERRDPGLNVTLVRCRLQTGRRNQIRVHFAEAGHPVLGDKRYQPRRAKHPDWIARGTIALHAAVLGFDHPITGQPLRFESPLPPSFKPFLHSSRRRPGPVAPTGCRPAPRRRR